MPSLNDTLRESLSGFEPMATRPALPPITAFPGHGNNFKPNTTIRTPLPPFNAGPDTLRQFDQDGSVPRRRVVPLPLNMSGGTGTVVNNTNTTIISGASSGGSSTSTLTAKTVVATSSIIPAGGFGAVAINMSSKSFQLISCTANSACEIRVYGSAIAQAIDASRVIDAPLPAELLNNIITDIVLDTAPFSWQWQNRVGANSQTPQSTNMYVSLFNLSGSPAAVQVTFVFLPLESL